MHLINKIENKPSAIVKTKKSRSKKKRKETNVHIL